MDDNGGTDLKVRCGGMGESVEISGGGVDLGEWGEYMSCPESSFICGVRALIKPHQGYGDDTFLDNIQLACCRETGMIPIKNVYFAVVSFHFTDSGFVRDS